MNTKSLLFPTDAKVSSREAVHLKAMELAAVYRRCEAELFEIITEIDDKEIYYDLQIPSLFTYCTEMLMLSRHTAYNFITVVRKAKEVPALREVILSQKTSISKARRICSVITEKNAKEWIGLIINCSSREVEKCVALANPRAAIMERMTYVAHDTLQFQLAVSEEWSGLLGSVKDLMSQKQMRAVSSEEALFILMQDYKIKNDPVLKAERAEKRKLKKALENPAKTSNLETRLSKASKTRTFEIDSNNSVKARILKSDLSKSAKQVSVDKGAPAGNISELSPDMHSSTSEQDQKRSRYIPASAKHALNRRDQNRCSFVDRHGKRCKETRWLQKHHIAHYADGGNHTVENLQTLCWGHHCMEHRRI